MFKDLSLLQEIKIMRSLLEYLNDVNWRDNKHSTKVFNSFIKWYDKQLNKMNKEELCAMLKDICSKIENDTLDFIKESSDVVDGEHGHWEEFVDEETGELTKVFRPDNPNNLKKSAGSIKNPLINWEEVQKISKELLDEEDAQQDLLDELKNLQDDLKDVDVRRKEMLMDMEEEIGALDVDNDDARDEIGNKYGVWLDELDDEAQGIKNQLSYVKYELSKIESNIEKLIAKRDNLLNVK